MFVAIATYSDAPALISYDTDGYLNSSDKKPEI